MAIKYIPYFKEPIQGQAILDNFTRTKRVLKYAENDKVLNRIERGMPLYEVDTEEIVGNKETENMVIRGECVSACAYLKENNIKVDLVYIDPPFASGADYAKTIYVRRNPKVAEAIEKAEEKLEDEELRTFEEKMYGDVWNKEAYLNWMYENLMAIKSVMSEKGSIYVHLDWHIGHYVKILMDEIFGEENFIDEIIWHYEKWTAGSNMLQKNHDVIYWYSKSNEFVFNEQREVTENLKKKYENGYLIGGGYGSNGLVVYDENNPKVKELINSGKYKVVYANTEGKPLSDVWDIPFINPMANERIDYSTQKPEKLLERIIKISSNENMVMADFFGGSGVTAKVANDLNRKFIHCDVGINSIETTRDRLIETGASFKVMDIKDGVNLYRNPVQTMEKIKSLIPGLKKEESISEFWSGVINDSKEGIMPVYIPNLMDSGTKILDIVLANKIINGEIPELGDGVRKVIIYYIDIIDKKEVKKFIKENLRRDIEIELKDLKEILDETVVTDVVEYHIEKKEIVIDKFISDRLIGKIDEYNEKMKAQKVATGKKGKRIEISNEGLELIEMISLDCTSKKGTWNSDEEIKIDKKGYVTKNGKKTKEFWDGKIAFKKKPLRIKIRNIAGDESVIKV